MGSFQKRAVEPMLAVEDAQARVLAEVVPLGVETLAATETLGRVLREDVVAGHDDPPADLSAMDGYAVRAADLVTATESTPVVLRVTADIPAGSIPVCAVVAGTAARIMTGAVVPPGADAVVQVEWTDAGRDEVRIERPVAVRANIRGRAADARQGDCVLREGVRIGPAEIAALVAHAGERVRVGRRPIVAIVATGSELVPNRAALRPGAIIDTNTPLLAALVTEVGATPRVLPAVADDRAATIAALETAAESDVVVTSGGVSVGAFDFVKDALDALGAETRFWRVAMKPGKPVVLSRLREAVCFGLPGNPVSSFVAFHLFVAPALRKMLGLRPPFGSPMIRVRLAGGLRGGADRRVYFRARAVASGGEIVATPLTSQSSGALSSMTGANALVVIEPGANADSGTEQPALLIGPLGGVES